MVQVGLCSQYIYNLIRASWVATDSRFTLLNNDMMRIQQHATILLLLLLLRPAPIVARPVWAMPNITKSFRASTGEFTILARHMQGNVNNTKQWTVQEHPVLYPQTPWSRPGLWFFEILQGKGTDVTELPIRNDNLYLEGFANKRGNWFRFEGVEQSVIPPSTLLSFNSTYRGLGYEGWRGLEGMELSREAVERAIGVLANYHPAITPDSVLKSAVATIIVVVIEAARFPYIRNLVNAAWNTSGRLDKRGAFLVVNWRRISCAIHLWNDKGRWEGKEVVELANEYLAITSAEQALAEIWPLLQPTDCSSNYNKHAESEV
ncbi:hypothetical protein ACP4OV_009899 [Aristida adscensionis]